MVDVSIEQVAALSSQNTLPDPTLDLDRLQPSTSIFAPTPTAYRRDTTQTIRPTVPAYSDDPWSTNRYSTLPPAPQAYGSSAPGLPPVPTASTGASSVAGSGLPDFWWQGLENVKVTLLGQQGFILNRYVVYEIVTEVRIRLMYSVVHVFTPFRYLLARGRCGAPLFGIYLPVGLPSSTVPIQTLPRLAAEAYRGSVLTLVASLRKLTDLQLTSNSWSKGGVFTFLLPWSDHCLCLDQKRTGSGLELRSVTHKPLFVPSRN